MAWCPQAQKCIMTWCERVKNAPPFGKAVICAVVLFVVWAGAILYGGGVQKLFEAEALAALFGGLAFVAMFFALIVQSKQLVLQKQELEETREVLKQTSFETHRLAKATEKSADLEEYKQKLSAIDALSESAKRSLTLTQKKYSSAPKSSADFDSRGAKLQNIEKCYRELQVLYDDIKSEIVDEVVKIYFYEHWQDHIKTHREKISEAKKRT